MSDVGSPMFFGLRPVFCLPVNLFTKLTDEITIFISIVK